LIIAPDTFRPDFFALIQDAHIPIYRAFIGFTKLRQIAETIRVTGYLTGGDDSATKVIEHFWETIEEAKAKRPANAAAPRVMGYGGQSTYGKETLFDDIITTLGGVNVAAQGGLVGYSPVNSEQIARWDPEWIVAGSAPGDAKRSVEAMLADPGIAVTKAARNHHIVVFDNRIFLPMSPFTVSLVKALSEALYG
jgi:iron complex transport system substrate-binding protein